MPTKLPFFNWSLKKLIQTETGSFNIARIKILYTIVLFSLAKILIVLIIAWLHQQHFQLARGFVSLALYICLLKFLLINKSYVKTLTHIMISSGILIILSILFISAQAINVVVIQFIFMAVVSSFYLLNRQWGIFYSVTSSLPVILFLIFPQKDWLHLNITPDTLAPEGTLIIVTFNFVTIIVAHYLYHQAFQANMAEKERLNEQLKVSVETAHKLAQSRADFLSTMSHELRTPLNAVIGVTDILLEESHNERQKENLDILKFSAVSLHTLINDILDFNRLGSEKLHLESVTINLADLMQKICSGQEVQAREKGLTLELVIDESLHSRYIKTDPIRLTQVIYNLVGNAIKFTRKGGVSVVLRQVSSADDTLTVAFSITDTGIGINAEKHQTIFDPFVQASTSTTRNFGGTGLGLAIVKRLLTLFGSEVHLTSTPGVGSVFSFQITFKTDAAPAEPRQSVSEVTGGKRAIRLLIVEDNNMNVFLLQKLCNRWNIQADIAVNGAEAVAKAQANNYDLILMDLHMPVMDGYEATRQIRSFSDEHKAAVIIIALTASVSDNLSDKIKAAGMNDYIHKPFDANELLRKLKEVVTRLI